MTTIDAHDTDIASAPERFRPMLTSLREQITGAAPDAEEVIEYGMPGFRAGGHIIASYAAFTKQCGFYASASAISEHAAEIAATGLKAIKTGITFSESKPLPEDLVVRLVRASRAAVGA